MKQIHTTTVTTNMRTRTIRLIQATVQSVNTSEASLTKAHCCTLAQLRTNKSPFPLIYLHKVNVSHNSSPLYPLCNTQVHDNTQLFTYAHVPTQLTILNLWTIATQVILLLDAWENMSPWQVNFWFCSDGPLSI